VGSIQRPWVSSQPIAAAGGGYRDGASHFTRFPWSTGNPPYEAIKSSELSGSIDGVGSLVNNRPMASREGRHSRKRGYGG